MMRMRVRGARGIARRGRPGHAFAPPPRVAGKALASRRGATSIEYGLIAAGIAVAIISVVFTLGNEISGVFETVQTYINSRAR